MQHRYFNIWRSGDLYCLATNIAEADALEFTVSTVLGRLLLDGRLPIRHVGEVRALYTSLVEYVTSGPLPPGQEGWVVAHGPPEPLMVEDYLLVEYNERPNIPLTAMLAPAQPSIVS